MRGAVLSSLGMFFLFHATARAFEQEQATELAPPLTEPRLSESQQWQESHLTATDQLTGLWKPQTLPHERASLVWFTEDERAFFVNPNLEKRQAVEIDYWLNPDTFPTEFDITFPGGSVLKGIIELQGSDVIRFEAGNALDDPRPKKFSKNAVSFKRISKSGILPEKMQVLTPEELEQVQQRQGVSAS